MVFLTFGALVAVMFVVFLVNRPDSGPELPACRLSSVIDWSAQDKQMAVAVRDDEGYIIGYRTEKCRVEG
jgi:hypothetical protein